MLAVRYRDPLQRSPPRSTPFEADDVLVLKDAVSRQAHPEASASGQIHVLSRSNTLGDDIDRLPHECLVEPVT